MLLWVKHHKIMVYFLFYTINFTKKLLFLTPLVLLEHSFYSELEVSIKLLPNSKSYSPEEMLNAFKV
jgi:hypothetical protein